MQVNHSSNANAAAFPPPPALTTNFSWFGHRIIEQWHSPKSDLSTSRSALKIIHPDKAEEKLPDLNRTWCWILLAPSFWCVDLFINLLPRFTRNTLHQELDPNHAIQRHKDKLSAPLSAATYHDLGFCLRWRHTLGRMLHHAMAKLLRYAGILP